MGKRFPIFYLGKKYLLSEIANESDGFPRINRNKRYGLDLEIKHVCNVDSQVLIYLDRADASLPAATVHLRTPGERGSLVINCRASSLYKLSQQGDKACTKITSDSTVGDA